MTTSRGRVVDAEAAITMYKTGASIRSVAAEFDMPFQTVRQMLLYNGVPFHRRDRSGEETTLEVAASEHDIRRILVALRDKGPMTVGQVRQLDPPRKDRGVYLQRLVREGYLSVRRTGQMRTHTLTGAGLTMLTEADALYQRRQPAALAARYANGETQVAIAKSVRLSVNEVYARIRSVREST